MEMGLFLPGVGISAFDVAFCKSNFPYLYGTLTWRAKVYVSYHGRGRHREKESTKHKSYGFC